ncbi:MAG TPA: AAA family ATPase [Elusimicrobiales bacterium]|nr:AAA family ATPase [Elusimicrobiales bacterium]
MLEKLFAIHNSAVKDTPRTFKRYLFTRIDWNSNAICVTGARGVGKTTMLLQYYHEHYGNVEKCLYVSADNVEATAAGLFNIASEYFAFGGKALIIDEIHKYPDWQIELKNIVDTFKGKKLLVSGSSSLDLKKGKADLSRRFAYYDLRGLSFREYLALKENKSFPALKLDDILHAHVKHAQAISGQTTVLKDFRNYLSGGYYPFFTESEAAYPQKVLNIIEKTLYEDVAVIGNVKPVNIATIKKILWLIAGAAAFVPNIDKLSRELGLSKEYVYQYLEYLEQSGIIIALHSAGKGYKALRKPAKLFLENTNLLAAINGSLKIDDEQGAVRETFFMNQVSNFGRITSAEKGDFMVNDSYIFEVGGKSKKTEQIQGLKNAYLALDKIEIGVGGKIPLYLFGFLY